jgi:hypothetical protein
MQPIRVLLGQMPRIPAAMLREAIADQQDMRLAEAEEGEALAAAVRRWSPDVLVAWGEKATLALELRLVFHVSPHVKVLTVLADGREIVLHELRPIAESVGQMAPKDLVSIIRSIVHHRIL